MLDPVGAVVAGHDQPDRVAVEHRNVGAVHLVGQHHLAVHRVVHVERLDEVAAAKHAGVQAVERDLTCAVLQLGARQHVLQRHAEPARVAHRAVGELPAGDARLEQAAAVARALVDRDHLDRLELRAQLGHRQLERLARRVAADLDDVLVAVDRGRDAGVVIAHEERVVGRDEAVVEDLERRLELRRTRGQHDQRPLLGVGHQVAPAVDHRQIESLPPGRRPSGSARPGRRWRVRLRPRRAAGAESDWCCHSCMSPGVVDGKWVCDEASTGPEKTLGLREHLGVVGQQQDGLAGHDFGKAPVPPHPLAVPGGWIRQAADRRRGWSRCRRPFRGRWSRDRPCARRCRKGAAAAAGPAAWRRRAGPRRGASASCPAGSPRAGWPRAARAPAPRARVRAGRHGP